MLVLSTDTLERLDRLQIDRDIRGIARWLYRRYAFYFDRIGADTDRIAKSIFWIYQWSCKRSLYRNKDLRLLAVMSISQGIHMNRDPRFCEDLDKAIRQFEMDQDQRIEHIYATFETWRSKVMGDVGFDTLLCRAADLIEGQDTAEQFGISGHDQLRDLLPIQEEWLGPKRTNQFFEKVQHDSLPTRSHMFANALLSTIFGYLWMDDPKFGTITKIFTSHGTTGAFRPAICDFLRGNTDHGG